MRSVIFLRKYSSLMNKSKSIAKYNLFELEKTILQGEKLQNRGMSKESLEFGYIYFSPFEIEKEITSLIWHQTRSMQPKNT